MFVLASATSQDKLASIDELIAIRAVKIALAVPGQLVTGPSKMPCHLGQAVISPCSLKHRNLATALWFS